MAPRRLRVLFVLALLAVGAFMALEMPRRRAADRTRREASRLFAFAPLSVDAVELVRPGATLRFELEGTRWTMRSPIRDDAEAGTVMPIITGLADAEIVRDLGSAGRLDGFGLAAPAVTVRLFARRDTVAILSLGDLTVDRSAVYARRGAGGVLLVPTSLHRATTLDVDDYRSRRVIVFDVAAVRGFEIDSRLTGHSAWRRAPGDAWFTVVAGDTVRGDSVAVPSVLRRLRGMRASAFPVDADTTAPALVSVTIHKDDGSSAWVRFQPRANGYFLARVGGNPRRVETADDPTDIAKESVATLRDRRVLQFDPLAAHRITVTTADTTAVLVRAGDAWALPNPALGDIDPRRAADFVRALRTLRYRRLWPDAPLDPRARPSFSLVILSTGGTIIDELQCAPAPGGASWVAWSRSLGALCEADGDAVAAIAALLPRLRR